MLKNLGKVLLSLIGIIVFFILTLFIAMSMFNSPTYAWRILRYGESDIEDDRIFPERVILNGTATAFIERAGQDTSYEVQYPYAGGTRKEPLEALLERTGTRALLILRDDKLIFESYLDSSAQDVHTSFSAAKSFSSALIGAAIAEGQIESVNDTVVAYIPEIAGRGLNSLTIRDLLLMNSGIRYQSNDEIPFYRIPFGDDALTYYPPDLRKVALDVQARADPVGRAFRYNNYHLLLEGLIIERATGVHVAEYLQEKFWKPMGAEFPASWSLDSKQSGFEKMESGINARAIDYARFGLIFLHDGSWNGVQIIPEDWVRESTEPLRPDPRIWESSPSWPDLGGYYKYHWWGINNPDGSYDYFAHGKFDQIIYVAPRRNAVIVRLGDARDPSVSWPLVLYTLIDQLQ